jgi:hypothetical protein
MIMKRFLMRCLVLLVLCLVVLLSLSRLYLQFVGTDYLRDRHETLKFKNVPYNIKYAGFGSSHSGASFQPESFPAGSAFSFYMSSQSVIMDAELYQLFREHLADGAVVALTISPMSLYSNPTNDMGRMKRYCEALPLKALPTLKTKLYRLFRVLDFRVDDIFEYFRTRSFTDISAAYAADVQAGRIANDDKSGLDWATWGATLATLQKETFTCDPTTGPEKMVSRALDEMLSDCVARGYRVVLYTPPFTDYFWGCFSEEFQTQLRKDASLIAAKNGVPYFDYSEDARFCQNMDYFGDVDHMSLSGSNALVSILLQDMDSFYQ